MGWWDQRIFVVLLSGALYVCLLVGGLLVPGQDKEYSLLLNPRIRLFLMP